MVITEGDRGKHVVVILEGPAEVIAPAEVPDDVRSAARGDWVDAWIRLKAERVLSYATEGAVL
jgi:hypothetical protein